MSRANLVGRHDELLGWVANQVAIANGMGRSDINIVSESLFQGILNLLEPGGNYVNVNIDAPNADSRDLADPARKIAIQITSTCTSAKIKKTIAAFKKNNHQAKYDVLRFLFLRSRYRPKTKYKVGRTKVEFWDLIQLGTLVTKTGNVDRIEQIVDLLDKELGPSPKLGPVVELAKTKLTVTELEIRIHCIVKNTGRTSAEDVQVSISSKSGGVGLIPVAAWFGMPGEPDARTFRSGHSIHPDNSIPAIVTFPYSGVPVKSLGFQAKVSAKNAPPRYVKISATRKELSELG